MKFDPTRAESLFRELSNPQYAGPDGEATVADLVASRLEGMGLNVERREVAGSRFPSWLAFWLGWPGYAVHVTAVYGLVLQKNPLVALLGAVLSLTCMAWLNAMIFGWIRPGRWIRPLQTAPVLIATLPGAPATPMRVVFHVVISGVKFDSFPFLFRGYYRRFATYGFLYLFPLIWAAETLIVRANLLRDPSSARLSMAYVIITRVLYPAFLVVVWGGVVMVLSRDYQRWRASAGRIPPDRRGLAMLLEMARAWPRRGSPIFEPVFVVAGGQDLDHAGSREVVRWVEEERSARPSLLIGLFGPGAGEELWIRTASLRSSGILRLAGDAARSLWIPFWGDEDFDHPMLTPYRNPTIALMGSDHRAFDDDTVDPQALNRAAQLATEIALRWAKKQDVGGSPESAG